MDVLYLKLKFLKNWSGDFLAVFSCVVLLSFINHRVSSEILFWEGVSENNKIFRVGFTRSKFYLRLERCSK